MHLLQAHDDSLTFRATCCQQSPSRRGQPLLMTWKSAASENAEITHSQNLESRKVVSAVTAASIMNQWAGQLANCFHICEGRWLYLLALHYLTRNLRTRLLTMVPQRMEISQLVHHLQTHRWMKWWTLKQVWSSSSNSAKMSSDAPVISHAVLSDWRANRDLVQLLAPQREREGATACPCSRSIHGQR